MCSILSNGFGLIFLMTHFKLYESEDFSGISYEGNISSFLNGLNIITQRFYGVMSFTDE